MANLIDIENFLEFLGDAILITNSSSEIVFANESCLNLFGYSESAFKNMTLDDLMNPMFKLGHRHKVESYINQKSQAKVMMSRSVMSCIDSQGRMFEARISIANIDFNGEQCGIAIIHDHSTIQSAISELKTKANTDNLTGLYNSRYLKKTIKTGHFSRGKWDVVGVVYFDLNKFKPINDTYGHHIGDALLTQIAQQLKEGLRTSDVIFRVGGDEFLILFGINNADYECELKTVCMKVYELISKPFFMPKIEKSIAVGVSIGAGIYPNDNNDLTTLIAMADKAMYRSKSSGSIFSLVSDMPSLS